MCNVPEDIRESIQYLVDNCRPLLYRGELLSNPHADIMSRWLDSFPSPDEEDEIEDRYRQMLKERNEALEWQRHAKSRIKQLEQTISTGKIQFEQMRSRIRELAKEREHADYMSGKEPGWWEAE